jgi:hypothetical protein
MRRADLQNELRMVAGGVVADGLQELPPGQAAVRG